MRLLTDPPMGEEPFEQSPGSTAWFNAGNRGVNEEFRVRAFEHLAAAGARLVQGPHTLEHVEIAGCVADPDGRVHIVLAHGTLDDRPQAGLRRTDTLKKVGFDARKLKDADPERQVIIVTSNLPSGRTGVHLLGYVRTYADVVATVDDMRGFQRLCATFGGVPGTVPRSAPTPAASQLDLFDDGSHA